MWLLGFGLVASCWIGYLSLPILSFYKEWVFVVALALAGLSLAQRVRLTPGLRQPLVVATGVIVLALLVHALITPGAWAKSALMACYGFVFICSIEVGRALAATDAATATEKFAWAVFIAALGSVVFAALLVDESPSLLQLVGAGCILAGLVAATVGRRPAPAAEPELAG